MAAQCNGEPTLTERDGLIHVECLACGDRWVTPVWSAS